MENSRQENLFEKEVRRKRDSKNQGNIQSKL